MKAEEPLGSGHDDGALEVTIIRKLPNGQQDQQKLVLDEGTSYIKMKVSHPIFLPLT